MEEKKRIGRPPKQGDKKTRTVQFRCEEGLYRTLVKATSMSQRTLSQEIAARLTESFRRPSQFTIGDTVLTMLPEFTSESGAVGAERFNVGAKQLHTEIEIANKLLVLVQERLRNIPDLRLDRREPPQYPPTGPDQEENK